MQISKQSSKNHSTNLKRTYDPRNTLSPVDRPGLRPRRVEADGNHVMRHLKCWVAEAEATSMPLKVPILHVRSDACLSIGGGRRRLFAEEAA